MELISLKELKKRKSKCFYNKQGKKYWVDVDGIIYFAYKNDIPTKKDREEYKEFAGCSKAVFASIGNQNFKRECKWYYTEDEVKKEVITKQEQNPKGYSEYYYEIICRGYNKPHPDELRFIFCLPKFDIPNIYVEKCAFYIVERLRFRKVANEWWELIIRDNPDFIEYIDFKDILEDIIAQYILAYPEEIEYALEKYANENERSSIAFLGNKGFIILANNR